MKSLSTYTNTGGRKRMWNTGLNDSGSSTYDGMRVVMYVSKMVNSPNRE